MERSTLNVIERVTEHYKKGRECLEIAEWGDENGPLKIYSFPTTLQEKRKIVDLSDGDEIEGLARAVILKCCDEHGNKMFDITHLEMLKRQADGGIIQEIVLWLNQGVDYRKPIEAVEDAVKNSPAIPSD